MRQSKLQISYIDLMHLPELNIYKILKFWFDYALNKYFFFKLGYVLKDINLKNYNLHHKL
jgi:Na+/H+ antiporter NhaA